MHLIQGFDLEMAGKHILSQFLKKRHSDTLTHNIGSLRKQIFLLYHIQVLGTAAMKKYPPGQSRLTKIQFLTRLGTYNQSASLQGNNPPTS